MTDHPKPPFPKQQQPVPGTTAQMDPKPDHGEQTYRGNKLLEGRTVLLTGGDSGIGRAVAIAYAREGADLVISYLEEHEDAEETARWVRDAGRRVVLVPGDLTEPGACESLVQRTMDEFGRLDVLVSNAAHQRTFDKFEDIDLAEWEHTFDVNVHSMFRLCRAAVPHMRPGSAIVFTSSINADDPSPKLLPYATTKGTIANFTAGLAGNLAERGIRVNAVAPGPIWTPLIPSTMPAEKVETFGKNTPMGRAGQPAELAGAYVLLASDLGSYMTGAVIAVTGGRPMI
jgi:NAD(P)-dependent dehydrogenase (short-subunit alcohol dehydrogenase family)